MDFEQFEKLAINERVTLFTALELLLQNGRALIQAKDADALVAACVTSLGGFFTEEKLCEAVAVCKELAGLELNVLVNFIQRSNMDIKVPGAEESGICPLCGCELEYGEDIPMDNGGVYEWTCPGCGATGREGYDKVFDKHYNVQEGPEQLPDK